MKIVVYNFKDQYALSRKQVMAIQEVLPNEYFAPIKEFHITHTRRGAEAFEWKSKEKIAHFSFPTKEKSAEIVAEAITELLKGLARIKEKTKWGYPIPAQEQVIYQSFIEKWKQRCANAAISQKP